MDKFKGIIKLLAGIVGAIIPVVLPGIFYDFKIENYIIREKTKKREVIDLYGIFLMVPILILPIQVVIREQVDFLKSILVAMSFILPSEAIIILVCKTWKLYKTENLNTTRAKKSKKHKNIITFGISMILWATYSILMFSIVYLSYDGIIKKQEFWGKYLPMYISLYLLLLSIYLIMVVATFKGICATKIKIDYNYMGKHIKKEINYSDFKVKSDYVSFYIENDRKRYFVPWDKINDIKVYYN